MWRFVLPKNTEDIDLSGYDFDKEELDKISKKLNKNQVRSLDISNNSLKTKELKIFSKAFEKSKVLDSLDLSNNELTTEGLELFSKIFSNSSLVTLNLSGNSLEDEGIILLSKYLKKNEMIKNLDISFCGFSDGGMEEISKLLLSEKCNLKRLDISNNLLKDVDKIFESLVENKKLKVLKISGIDIIYDCLFKDLNICKMLEKNNSLKQLNMNDCLLTYLDLYYILCAMSTNPTLEILNINRTKHCYINNHSNGYKEQTLKKMEQYFQNTSLRVLNLKSLYLDEYMLNAITNRCTSLQILNLEGNYLGNHKNPMQAFESLKKNETLKELYLKDNYLSSIQLEPLFEILKENNTLEKLDISENSILSPLSQNIADYLQKNTSLLVLKMDKCGIKSKGQAVILKFIENNHTLVYLSMKCSNTMLHFETSDFPQMYESIKENRNLEELYLMEEKGNKEIRILISKIMERNEICKNIQTSFKHSTQRKLNDIQFSFVFMAYKRPFEE
jgi:Ran GTPase-activating protein (RanGAP) involved in mRNA processing and transport